MDCPKSKKILRCIQKLSDLVESGVEKSTASFMRFGKIVSISVAFLEFTPCKSLFYFNFMEKSNQNIFFNGNEKRQTFFIYSILGWVCRVGRFHFLFSKYFDFCQAGRCALVLFHYFFQ